MAWNIFFESSTKGDLLWECNTRGELIPVGLDADLGAASYAITAQKVEDEAELLTRGSFERRAPSSGNREYLPREGLVETRSTSAEISDESVSH